MPRPTGRSCSSTRRPAVPGSASGAPKPAAQPWQPRDRHPADCPICRIEVPRGGWTRRSPPSATCARTASSRRRTWTSRSTRKPPISALPRPDHLRPPRPALRRDCIGKEMIERIRRIDQTADRIVGKYASSTTPTSRSGPPRGHRPRRGRGPRGRCRDLEDESDVQRALAGHGVLVGGFGERGLEGKIRASGGARTAPLLRDLLGCSARSSSTPQRARPRGRTHARALTGDRERGHLARGRPGRRPPGGTMRLGAYACDPRPGTLAADLYGANQ